MTDQEILDLLDELDKGLGLALSNFDEGKTGFLNLACIAMKIENTRVKLENKK